MTRLPLIIVLVTGMYLAGSVTGYFNVLAANHEEVQTMSAKTIEETLKAHTGALMAIPGVVGVGQGLLDNKPCIKVFVVEKTPELEGRIPKVLEGHPIVVEQSGAIKAQPKSRTP
jgi:hypothetical protein